MKSTRPIKTIQPIKKQPKPITSSETTLKLKALNVFSNSAYVTSYSQTKIFERKHDCAIFSNLKTLSHIKVLAQFLGVIEFLATLNVQIILTFKLFWKKIDKLDFWESVP